MRRGERSRREALALVLIFFFALLAWGMSMWTLKTRLSGPLLVMVQNEARQDTLKPWLQRAKQNGISYALAVSAPAAVEGKAVFWKVEREGEGAFEGGRRDRRLTWTNPKALTSDPSVPKSGPFWVLGIVDRGGRAPRLRYLGANLAD